MDKLEILKIVKRKLFETRKKLIYDTFGNKVLVEGRQPRETLVQTDRDLLDENDGWNVADRDYVDIKVSELLTQIQHLPTAPSPHQISALPNSNKFSLYSPGVYSSSGSIAFFQQGLVLKKNCIISEVILTWEGNTEDELSLMIRNIDTDKSDQMCKIKPNPHKKYTLILTRYKSPDIRAVTLEIPVTKPVSASLQITLDF